MALTPAQKKYLTVEQVIGPAVFNFFINALIAWGVFRSFETVPLWGAQSIAGDTIGTAFILPFLTGLIVTPLVRGQVKKGKLEGVSSGSLPGYVSILAERSTFVRSLLVGLVGMVALGLPVVGLWVAVGPAEMDPTPFIWIKGTLAGAFAAILTPVISWAALVHSEERR